MEIFRSNLNHDTKHNYSSRPSDKICRHRAWSTLAPVMAWCLTTPSFYLNMCSEIILLKLQLTLNVQGLSYLGLTRSISWLLMPWLLTSPGHQQPWYRLCRIDRFLSYLRKDLNYQFSYSARADCVSCQGRLHHILPGRITIPPGWITIPPGRINYSARAE